MCEEPMDARGAEGWCALSRKTGGKPLAIELARMLRWCCEAGGTSPDGGKLSEGRGTERGCH